VLVEYAGGAGTPTVGASQTLVNPKWIHHNRFGYVFPKAGNVNLQSGSLFAAYFNHGPRPANASYAYIVLPNAAPAQVQAFANANPITVVRNEMDAQAVYHASLKIGGAVFYKAGSVALRPDLTLTVDGPCVLLIADKPTGIHVTAANAERKSDPLSISVTQGAGKETAAMDLPTGESAGASRTKVFFPKAGMGVPGAIPAPSNRFWHCTGGRLEISPMDGSGYEITVASADGRIALKWAGKGPTSGPGLKPGIYTLRMKTGSGEVRKTAFTVLEGG
jgi:hypothetical protein